uniref:Peptidyl-prolyl cis-trans isomerase n=1 Tax=Chromera velia CCMP2878 TaxID=1169474 RepID=A0A0G4G8A7_9ALVE|mmetsp:Transcript_16934/g.34364  ORF Transcript_16934/g.34364 Transcript_16934/m.34364 type:complete len:192 (-) Transcript_16934:63-638(-)|eukprot:Cvel_20728.t1-p1 / transcript=Cvel_20728.t1 / gene=Cvel_20728 / organism=Chromera_velia_CCMP2878 / gene_product=Peptidyl-prolyl cis-trans isomerase-like 3, putative / transcript_product=Peptidyl-prolyl cis-trans isomerase-like 3, putative / location=Cvel_scaffold1887:9330-15362(+) / protein_length=191 / sequence_SO=supercontig / SO=protein_coding / is_pseudo=false
MSVVIHTTVGALRIRLFWRETPKTCRNFIELCKCGYYDGCLIHRVIKGFMFQTGLPDVTKPNSGTSIYKSRQFEDEICATLSHDRPGTVSMVNEGKRNTNTCEFFVSFTASPHLDGRNTLFGELAPDSLELLADIELVKTTKGNRPVRPLKIFQVQVEEDPWTGEPLPPDAAELPERPLVPVHSPPSCAIS